MIQLIDVTLSDTLRNVNLTIHTGECIVLIGMSGAGKSTLTMLIGGVLVPDEGTILINNTPPKRYSIHRGDNFTRVREQTMFVYRTMSLLKYHTVEDSINWTGDDSDRMNDLLALVEFTEPTTCLIGDLTPLQQFQVGICKALIHSPEILVLDDVWCKMPVEQRIPMWKVLNRVMDQCNISVIVTAHDFHDASWFGCKAYGVHNGKVALLPELTEQSFARTMGVV